MDFIKLRIRHFLILLVCLAFVFPSSTLAQVDRMTFDVYLSNEGENVNAFGGVLHYPASWSIDNITLQNAKLIYWIAPPGADTFGEISFSGVVPGGVQNLEASTSDKLLYSIDFVGDDEAALGGGVFFEEDEFYLNHPAALAATNASFTYSSRPTDLHGRYDYPATLLDLSFSFEKDPITGEPSLVLDSYRGELASYVFAKKEGDFNFNAWLPVDGVGTLDSSFSTVKLSVLDSEGIYHTLLIRSSFLRVSLLTLTVILSLCAAAYIFIAALKMLRFKPKDMKKMKN